MNQPIDSIQAVVEQGFIIPPKPDVLDQIQRIIGSDEPSMTELSDAICEDVGLSAAVLKTINSPMYGMSRTISDMKQATFLLGADSIRMIVGGMIIREHFTEESCISMERFWDTATETTHAMVYICDNLQDKVPQEDLYAVGLFHDCGVPALAIKYQDYVQVLMEANDNQELQLIDIEEQHYQTNHAIIGFYIASSWGLPPNICQLILRHHDLTLLDDDNIPYNDLLTFAVFKAAENIVTRVRRGLDSDDWPHIKDKVMETLGIDSTTYGDMQDSIEDILIAEPL